MYIKSWHHKKNTKPSPPEQNANRKPTGQSKQGTNNCRVLGAIRLHNDTLLREATRSLVALLCTLCSLGALIGLSWRRLGLRSFGLLLLRRSSRCWLRLRLGLLAAMQSSEVDLSNVLVESLALGLSDGELKSRGLAGAVTSLR